MDRLTSGWLEGRYGGRTGIRMGFEGEHADCPFMPVDLPRAGDVKR